MIKQIVSGYAPKENLVGNLMKWKHCRLQQIVDFSSTPQLHTIRLLFLSRAKSTVKAHFLVRLEVPLWSAKHIGQFRTQNLLCHIVSLDLGKPSEQGFRPSRAL